MVELIILFFKRKNDMIDEFKRNINFYTIDHLIGL